MSDDEIDDFLSYIRKNKDRIKKILGNYTPNQVLKIRRTFAESGTELTPDEVETMMDQLTIGLMMVESEEEGMSDSD